MADASTPKIVAVEPLNGRSLRVDFEDGSIRLFDGYRLRGPQFIPMLDPEVFVTAHVRDGRLAWENKSVTVSPEYVRKFSVPYDPNYDPGEYVPKKRDIIGEKIAIVLFPIMAIAGVIGTVWWYINN